jgi:hypothetical protein
MCKLIYLDIYIVTCLLKDWNSGAKETAVAGERPINTLSRQWTRDATIEEVLEIVFSIVSEYSYSMKQVESWVEDSS